MKATFLSFPLLAIGLTTSLVTSNIASAQLPEKVKSVEDLKKIQKQLKLVVKKVRPATVALTSTRTGSSGSGVVVSKEGIILTAAHVVQGNKEVNVVFNDGKAYKAKVLGSNRTKDIAMVKLIDKKDWPVAAIGDSSKLSIGGYVVAMGHAGGFDTRRKPPVRFGRLLSRNPNGFITTDCTLIGGDSGGPIFDINGNVIGINSSIGNSWALNNHAGISALVQDWERLEKGDNWGRLNSNPMADPDSPVFGFMFEENNNKGVLIKEVLPKSAAAKAGMKAGDILTGFEKSLIKNGRDLIVQLSRRKPGEKVSVTVTRDQKVIKLEAVLDRRGNIHR